MNVKKISLLLASLCALFLVACSNQKQADGKLNIVTTFYPVYEFTKQVAGDTANVELLIGAGTEPHEYEPSAKAVAKIQDADTFVYENENMETWVPKLLDTLDKKKVKTIKATGDMLLLPGGEEEEGDHDHGEEGHHHEYDPHVWLSPVRAIKLVEHIRDSLSADYPNKNLILSVKSGLTGLAQISGRRDISFSERRKLDIYYVQNWSMILDIQIIIKTIWMVLVRRGAK